MTKDEIYEVIKRNLLEILPGLEAARIAPQKSMKDLGANSIDRVDVIIVSMEALSLKLSLNELGGIENIQGLVDFFYARSTQRNS